MPPSNTETPATIDLIGEDLLHNIVARLPATSFASAACVSRSWNLVCERVLSRPKLASACSFNPSYQAAVEEVLDKVLSEPIRPHFAIVSIGGSYESNNIDSEDDLEVLEEALELITAALGSKVQVITNRPSGIIGRDVLSNEFKEIELGFGEENDSILLIVGFLPGLKVTTIPLRKNYDEQETFMIDEFVTDIREFSTSVSGCNSPAAIIMFGDEFHGSMMTVMEKMDYAMSPETVIVGDTLSRFRCTNEAQGGISVAVALVFAVDRNKPPGIGETQFHAILSSGLSPVGPTYKATSVIEKDDYETWIAARREGSDENIDGETILNRVYDEIGDRIRDRQLCIGVTKTRKCSISQEKVGCMTSLALHGVCGNYQEYFVVHDVGIKTGDTFRFNFSNTNTALSSAAAVSSYLRSLNQGSNNTTGGDKQEVFGGLIFTSPDASFFGQPDVNSSPFLDNFPGVAFGGTFCSRVIGRSVLTPHVKEFQEPKAVGCCVHAYCAVYLVMSYTL
ncbi:putative F-box domain, FIST domain, F-box-like domain superfamily protein [Helianthus debilis subsp. tardiflorus]